jgi:hypothetical protein
MTQSTTEEWLALVVSDVDEGVLRGLAGVDALRTALPTVMVDITLTNTSDVAILSWRWDIWHNGVRPSRNIQAAVRIAKRLQIQYLLIDCLAIDQTLEEDQLIGHVMSFSALYSKLRVLAAYDMEGEAYANTLRRPWIVSEIKAMVKNPNRIFYVGHGIYRRDRQLIREYFKYIGWQSSSTALRLLFGAIEMKCHSDFKFLMPLYARLLSKAYEQMSRNDYLLTVALLCVGVKPCSNLEAWDITTLSFDQYSIRNYRRWASWGKPSCLYDLYLGNTEVGCWKYKYDRQHGHQHQSRLECTQSTERAIFTALGLDEAEWEEFVANEADRQAFLFPPDIDKRENLELDCFVSEGI